MAKPHSPARTEVYRRVFDAFTSPISRFDCGQKCGQHNGGKPYCCTTNHAIPILEVEEYALLRSRSDLWHEFKPVEAAGRKIVAELHEDHCAAECKGAQFCER